MAKQLMTGNEAVARGAWEAGVLFASAYPGTPSTEILENVGTYKEITAEWAPNEKVAMEAAIGASIGGVRSMCAQKHVGLNVAADPIFTYAYMGVTGGMVFVSADDPSAHSSQDEQDNRNYAPFMHVPMLEPSDSQEAKDLFAAAFDISEQYDTPVLFRMTTRVCHSKSLVELGERRTPTAVPYVKNMDKFDDVPRAAMRNRRLIVEREAKLRALSEHCPYNFAEYNGDGGIGVIASGISYQYAREVFGDSASYLKLGLTNPLPLDLIREFRSKVRTLYVIEELDPYIERQLKEAGIDCIGKAKIPAIGELNPAIIRKALLGIDSKGTENAPEMVVPRPPAMCPGCPHRGFFYLLGKRKNTVIVGDIGCYGLSGNAPLRAKDMGICMGSAFSVGHGLAKAFAATGQDKTVVACVGDSTFFHTGVAALEEVVYNCSRVICCVLDNRTTGMTGHQDNPGSGRTLAGDPAPELDVAEIARALRVKNVRTIDPRSLDEVRSALDWAYERVKESPVVLVMRRPCVLKPFSEEDKRQFDLERRLCAVDAAKCVGCRTCLSTGCPALSFDKAAKKAAIDPIQCVGCTVCAQTCPVKAIALCETENR